MNFSYIFFLELFKLVIYLRSFYSLNSFYSWYSILVVISTYITIYVCMYVLILLATYTTLYLYYSPVSSLDSSHLHFSYIFPHLLSNIPINDFTKVRRTSRTCRNAAPPSLSSSSSIYPAIYEHQSWGNPTISVSTRFQCSMFNVQQH